MAAKILNYDSLRVITVQWKEAVQKAQMYLLNRNNGFTMIEDIKLGLLPGGSALSLARLSHDNQGEWDRVTQTHRLKAKECHQLIDLWCKADTHQQKKFLLDYPH